jgi:hypothetical protein
MHRQRPLFVLLCVLAASLAASPTLAQRSTASIRAVVEGPDGALPGVTVVVRSGETGLSRTAVSDARGAVTFGDLPVGTYEVVATLEGFQEVRLTGLALNVADVRQVNIQLPVGSVDDEITVAAAAVSVELIGGAVAGLITGQQVRELPLNGRNFTQLTLLMPGVSQPENFDTKNKGLLTGTDLSVSGGSTTSNQWLVDGANNNDVGSNRTILVYPSVDAIEEFKIHRNSYGAEFGGASGAVINLVTRGGGNEFQGSLFWFQRDDGLNEKNHFLERSGGAKEPLDRDDFGFTVGGPIVRDKLYFFTSAEWNDEVRGVVRSGFVPTAAERSGDFSNPVPGCSGPAPIDPLTGQPFPGNVIPTDRLSPGGLAFLGLFPLPNTAPASGTCFNWVEAVETPIDWEQYNARVDWDWSESSRLMVRYTRDDWVNAAPNAGESNGLWGDDPFPIVDSNWDQVGESFVTQLNQTFGGSIVNTLQFSYSGNEIDISRGGRDPELNARITSLIPPLFGGKTGGGGLSHPVFWGGGGYAPLWNIAPWENHQDLMVLQDDYQQVFGKHWVKAGVRYSDNEKRELIGGASAFETPQFWGGAGFDGWGATTGNVLGDFLLKDMTHGFAENSFQPDPTIEWKDYEAYLHDSWEVMPTLVVDLGLRYSLFTPPEAANDRIGAFDPDLFDPALGSDPCNGLMVPPGTDPCGAAGFQGGAAGPSAGLVEKDTDNLAPRLGFAWDVFGNGRTAVRGGFGQFYLRDRVNVQLEFAGNPPFTRSQAGIRKLDDVAEPCEGCFATGLGFPHHGIDPDNETPYNLQWNLTFEQAILESTTIEVGYVASRGKHIARRVDINQVPAGDVSGNGVTDRLEFVQCGGDPGCRAALRPYGVFGDSTILFWQNDGESEYDSLQTQLVSRFGRGSHLQVSYTYSQLEANDPLNDAGAGTFAGQITDLSNPGLDWGKAALHRPHVANASLLYHLPALEGRGSWIEALLGDWGVGLIGQYATGTALTVYTGTVPGLGGGPAGTGFTDNQRAIRVPGEPCRASGGPPEQWLNPNAFTLVGYRLGDTSQMSSRGSCEGPDYFQVDMSLFKDFRITGRVRAQLRFEVFNVTNETNFFGVNTTLGPTSVTLDGPVDSATEIVDFTPSGSFGQAFGARDPRQIQLGFKLFF